MAWPLWFSLSPGSCEELCKQWLIILLSSHCLLGPVLSIWLTLVSTAPTETLRRKYWDFPSIWLRIHQPVHGTQVWSLVQEDYTCHRATKPMSHSCWAHALQWEKSRQREAYALQLDSSPHSPQLEKACVQQLRPSTAINKYITIDTWDFISAYKNVKEKQKVLFWVSFCKQEADVYGD